MDQNFIGIVGEYDGRFRLVHNQRMKRNHAFGYNFKDTERQGGDMLIAELLALWYSKFNNIPFAREERTFDTNEGECNDCVAGWYWTYHCGGAHGTPWNSGWWNDAPSPFSAARFLFLLCYSALWQCSSALRT